MLDTFTVIAEPRRRQILDVLLSSEATVNELADILAMSQPAVSKHLRVLRDSGFVTVTPLGQRRIYRIDPTPLQAVEAWVRPYQQLWSETLSRLDTHLTATRTPQSPSRSVRSQPRRKASQ